MDNYEFNDALSGSKVVCAYPGLETYLDGLAEYETQPTSVFFPGCSFINYGLPLVSSVYDLLKDAGKADGISLLCCGKILAFEPNGDVVRANFEEELRQETIKRGIKRYIVACPNCMAAMRDLFAADPATAGIEVVVLPQVLADLGYQVDEETAQQVFADEWNEGMLGGYSVFEGVEEGAPAPKLIVSPKDSCPDRPYGEFADALRRLIPESMLVEPAQSRTRSVCCGSLPRAAGKWDAANKCAQINGAGSVKAGANAMVTSCVSCCFQLTMAQACVPVYHYLELLYGWRIPWACCEQYMKLRFLFDDHLGVEDSENRNFMALGQGE